MAKDFISFPLIINIGTQGPAGDDVCMFINMLELGTSKKKKLEQVNNAHNFSESFGVSHVMPLAMAYPSQR